MALALLFWAPTAYAQTPEAEAIAVHIAHELMDAVDFQAAVAKGAEGASMSGLNDFRPTWSTYLKEALAEEGAQSGPLIEKIIGSRIAKLFTLDELKAGDIIMSDPQIKAAIAAGARGEQPSGSGCSRTCMRALDGRAGQAFMRKAGDFEQVLGKDAMSDLMAAFIPGFLRRFADKIEAGERANPPQR